MVASIRRRPGRGMPGGPHPGASSAEGSGGGGGGSRVSATNASMNPMPRSFERGLSGTSEASAGGGASEARTSSAMRANQLAWHPSVGRKPISSRAANNAASGLGTDRLLGEAPCPSGRCGRKTRALPSLSSSTQGPGWLRPSAPLARVGARGLWPCAGLATVTPPVFARRVRCLARIRAMVPERREN